MTSPTGQIDDSDKITPALLKIAGVVVLGAIMPSPPTRSTACSVPS